MDLDFPLATRLSAKVGVSLMISDARWRSISSLGSGFGWANGEVEAVACERRSLIMVLGACGCEFGWR